MRKTFDITLTQLAERDESIYLLVNDLGNFPTFEKKFSNRFINVGIAEPNMVSIASGLALDGCKVFVYSVAGFCIHRGFEQLKFEVGNLSKNINIVNAGANLCYNRVGSGHYLIDDFAIMRTLPNVNIYAPIDRREFKSTVEMSYRSGGFNYIRTGMDGCCDVDVTDGFVQFSEKNKVTVVSTGALSNRLYDICKDIPVDVYHALNPKKIKEDMFKEKIVVIEDHIKFGGLTTNLTKKQERHICLPDIVDQMSETNMGLLKKYGLDDDSLRDEILRLVCN